ncbi:protein phosphatase 2C domain-containing protein [Candidatus Woesearchaeota archaeon]|nr:protein phosphatase 2C domain-containing protein [Candidatus Woesearchaeota archaeon]
MNYLEFITKTEFQNKRSEQQDRTYYDLEQGIILVADGLGGEKHLRGDYASQLAVEEMRKHIESNNYMIKEKIISEGEITYWFKVSLEKTNELIAELSHKTEQFKNTGTTLEALHIYKNRLYYAHIGDSATFIIRPNEKNYVNWSMHGSIQKLAQEHNSNKENTTGFVTSYLGRDSKLSENKFEFNIYKLQPGDIIFSCTDGVTNPLITDDILDIFTNNRIVDVSKKIIERVNNPVGRLIELQKKGKKHTLQQYLGDNASFVIYQVGNTYDKRK